MSITQTIRDRGALISAILIGLALLGFILMDAFSGRGNMFGGGSSTLGKVNGKKIDLQEFSKELAAIQQNQANSGEQGSQQAIENLWNYKVNRILLEEQFSRLGIGVGTKELNDMIYTNPHQYMQQYFGDPQTGQYDAARVAQYISQVRKSNNEEAKKQISQIIDAIEFDRLTQKYNSLLVNSINVPKWFVEKQIAENSMMAKVSYVMVPYTTINDSTIKITDKEIKDYVDKHEDQFQQKEETRSFNYVQFNASASATDSLAILEELRSLKQEFATTDDAQAFIQRNGSAFDFHDGYVAKSAVQVPDKDSIFALPNGGVYGPYLDPSSQGGQSAFVVAKKIDEKILPDSARVRHILIKTGDPQTGVVVEDSVARRRIDSIEAAIRAGANFDTLAKKLSEDPGSANAGGIYDYFAQGAMVKAFNDFAFEKNVGDKGVVKTEFGYHYIEVLGQRGSQPYYKIAYLARSIGPSTETDQAAQNAAIDFAGKSKNLKEFTDNWEKTLKPKNIQNVTATNIKPNDYNIQGLGISRALVKAVFEADKGDVVQPEKVGESHVVAVVTEINEKGTMSVESARSAVESVLRNEKKAAQIKKTIGKVTTLEAASTATGQPVQTLDSLRFSNSQLGFAYKVIGAAFNPANKGKVVTEPIEDNSGVFVLRVDDQSVTPVASANVEEQRNTLQMTQKQQLSQMLMYGGNNPDVPTPVNTLRKGATIKDNRSKFY